MKREIWTSPACGSVSNVYSEVPRRKCEGSRDWNCVEGTFETHKKANVTFLVKSGEKEGSLMPYGFWRESNEFLRSASVVQAGKTTASEGCIFPVREL